MTKISLKRWKILTLVVFFLSFTLGAMAQSSTPRSETMQVLASHYPVPSIDGCPYVKINWGMEMDLNYFDFEYGVLPDYWINDDTYPWEVTTPDTSSYGGYHGNFCIRSGNSGISNSTSSIEATVDFERSGSISFLGGCWGEGSNYDVCQFFIDGQLRLSKGDLQTWGSYSFDVSAGTHVFKWSYTKDGSVNSPGDAFFVDDVTFDGVAGSRASSSAYNIYRRPCSASGGPIADDELIAENVTSRQYIDSTWIELADGEYQYGVENLWGTSGYTYWSNCLTKTELASLNITASANSTDRGTVRGGGTFTFGDTCTLTAIANYGYQFGGWIQMPDSLLVSSEQEYSFTVTANANLVANFEPDVYYYWINIEPENGGEAELIGCDEEVFYYGDTIILHATPSIGFSFDKWMAAGSEMRAVVELPSDTIIINEAFLDSLFWNIEYADNGIEFIVVFTEGINGCKRPSQLTNTDLAPDYATISWTENGIADSWYIFYHDETPAPAYTPFDTIRVYQNSFTFTELSPDTEYKVFVVPSCGIENGVPISDILISDTLTFTTLGPCPTPLHAEVTSVTGTTATMTWLDYSASYNAQLGLADIVLYENFDNGAPTSWNNSSDYPWIIVDGHLQSGNEGVNDSNSSISVTVTYTSDGILEFDAECRGEESSSNSGEDDEDEDEGEIVVYDECTFYIDGQEQFTYGESIVGWQHYSFDIPAGEHTFTWSYTKDGSLSKPGDYFAIDNVIMRDSEIEWTEPISFEEAPYIITDLAPNTIYFVRVQGVCDTLTEWCDPLIFTTTDAQSCTITVSANPRDAGSVSGGGELNIGSTCTLSATANTGYTFLNWTLNDSVVSSNANYSFTVTEGATYVANFQLNSYTLTVNYKYADGTSAAATHTESVNYGDDYSVSSPSITGFTPNLAVVSGTMGAGDVTVDVTYSVNSYTLTVNYKYADGTSAAATHTESVNYGDDYSVSSPSITGYTPNLAVVSGTMGAGDVTVDVTYSVNSYTLTVNYKYADGTSAAATHTESVNYGDDYSVSSPSITGFTPNLAVVSGTMGAGDVTVDVTYNINSYEITATIVPAAGGSVNGTGTYDYGSSCTLIATANEGYSFVSWTKNGVVISSNPRYHFTVTEAEAFVANFSLNSYEITTSANPTAGGSVNGAGTYNYGTSCTLTATVNDGYSFVNWTKNGVAVSTNASYTFTVTEAAAFVANFSLNGYEITASANPADGGTITGAGTYNHFETCTLTATANAGYTFVNWTKNGQVVGYLPAIHFTVTEAANYVANFQLNSYQITATASPAAGGSVSGAGNYNHFETCTLTATANTGYTFVNWTKDGEEVSTSASYTFTVTEAATYVANFNINSYVITASASPTAGGSVAGAGNYNYGSTCTLTATANVGYTFVNWTKNGQVVSTDADYSFTVTRAASFVAHFQLSNYEITATANPTEGGSVTGAGNYSHGSSCTLFARANEGYAFLNWTKDGVVVSSYAAYTFTVTEAADYVANFSLNSYEIKANTDPDNTGVIEGIGFYNYGEICTLTVIPFDEYEFVNWTLGSEVVSETETFSFTVTEERNYVAHLRHVEGVGEQGGITVSLYPNPAKHRLNIEASEPVNMLEIFTINGALVYRQNDCSDNIVINVENYANGTYMIRLTTDSTVEIRRFVKE